MTTRADSTAAPGAPAGLARARAVRSDPRRVAEELRRSGTPVIGYLSVQLPLEILAAAGAAPLRIFGDIREPVTEADRGLPAAFCPYMRSVLDLGLKGRLDFLDGFVLHHTCDAQEKTVRVLASLVSFPYTHFVDLPATTREPAVHYFREQLADFRDSLEALTGTPVTRDALEEAIALYNEQRRLVRELYRLKQPSPPLLTGRESLEVVTAVQTLPVREGNRLLREVLGEARTRADRPAPKEVRLLLWGGVLHDPAYLDVIEAGGAHVVVDDLDEGLKPYLTDVAPGGDPLEALARRYLVGVYAARTFREAPQEAARRNRRADLEARYGHLGRLVREWAVDGALLQAVRYCDPHGCEVVDVGDYLESLGVPSIYLEHDYTEGSLGPLRTRVEAFVETLA
ncbi:MAG: double-cubane-cluster-containing anaerobic reductase [Deferrisomatales bacterium]